MTLREILSGTSNWLRSHRYAQAGCCEPALDDDGLLAMGFEREDDFDEIGHRGCPGEAVMVNTIAPRERRESMERLQEGFNRLVGQLEQINDHLTCQLAQHEELMGRVKELPRVLESLPSAVENQKRLTAELIEQLRRSAARERQFSEVMERIPCETSRQTDALVDINHQLAAAADIDVQMAESFTKFRIILDHLNHNTVSNTEGILQMSKTFAASDRYLKYVISRLNKRYTWTLAMALSVCVAVVASLVGVIVYLVR